jgi:hypothetical protein
MTGLCELVREELADQAASGTLPVGLGDRVVGVVRRRRHRRQTVGAAVVTLAAVAAATVLTPRGGAVPATGPGPNAVFAYRESDAAGGPVPWRVLNPVTGDYRALDVETVTPPTADLRRMAVELPTSNGRRGIGIYDTVSGLTTALLDLPGPLGTPPRISPDGRYVVAGVASTSPDPTDWFRTLMLIDLSGGPGELIDIDPELAAAATTLSFRGNGVILAVHGEGPIWHPDGRHLVLGKAILDLRGQRVATVPIPEHMMVTALRSDGAGTLALGWGVQQRGLSTYALVDARGDITRWLPELSCAVGETDVPSAVPVSPPPTADPSVSAGPDPSDAADPYHSADPPYSADPSDPSASAGPGSDASATSDPDPSASSHPDTSTSSDPSASPVSSGTPEPDYSTSPDPDGSESPGPRLACWYRQFLSWRGTDAVLMTDGERFIAVDTRTGDLRMVRPAVMPPTPESAVIVSAEHLSDQARQLVSF